MLEIIIFLIVSYWVANLIRVYFNKKEYDKRMNKTVEKNNREYQEKRNQETRRNKILKDAKALFPKGMGMKGEDQVFYPVDTNGYEIRFQTIEGPAKFMEIPIDKLKQIRKQKKPKEDEMQDELYAQEHELYAWGHQK